MKNLFINIDTKILDALKRMTKIGEKNLLVINDNKTLLGTLSDGDCRKAILKGIDLTEKIDKYYNKNPLFIYQNDFTKELSKKIFIKNKITVLPIIDSAKKVINVLFWHNIFEIKKPTKKINKKIPVVIMAGGVGSRMKPFTDILPKALIPIGNKPIIENIINKFNKYGLNNFYISLNYKAQILKAYLNEIKLKNKIEYKTEKKSLGTIGAISLMKKNISTTFFLTNCDIIIKADYYEIYKHHIKAKNDLTIIVVPKQLKLPYGNCKIDETGSLLEIVEKPFNNFLVNAGFYLMEPNILKLLKTNKKLDFDVFVKLLKFKKYKIGVYPIDDISWIDVGNWSDYSRFKSSNITNSILYD